jgi:hypothetical protein
MPPVPSPVAMVATMMPMMAGMVAVPVSAAAMRRRFDIRVLIFCVVAGLRNGLRRLRAGTGHRGVRSRYCGSRESGRR